MLALTTTNPIGLALLAAAVVIGTVIAATSDWDSVMKGVMETARLLSQPFIDLVGWIKRAVAALHEYRGALPTAGAAGLAGRLAGGRGGNTPEWLRNYGFSFVNPTLAFQSERERRGRTTLADRPENATWFGDAMRAIFTSKPAPDESRNEIAPRAGPIEDVQST